jgi:preprotein translocase subunit YajC
MPPGLIIIVALFAVVWFVMIRPQRAKQQKQRSLLSAVAPGDEILTVGGIYGIVQEFEEDEEGDDLVVEIAEGIHVRVARRAVATVVKPEDDEDDEDDEDEDDPADDAADDDDHDPDTDEPDTAPVSERS